MKFVEPLYLILGIVACIGIYIIFQFLDKKNREILSKFASEHLLKKLMSSFSPWRRLLKRILLLIALFFLFAALSRPQWGFHWQEVKRKGIDIFFAVDVSKSMLAQDIKPNRLSRAKLAVLDFASKLGGDRVGLIAFAGTAFTQCPLTLDYDAFAETLNELVPDIIPKGGSNLAAAIDETLTAVQTQKANHKILILLTDGEDLEAQGLIASRRTAEEGLKIFTVGVGTPQGELIPIENNDGGVQFVKDANGRVVKSRLDENALRKIAETTGGFYTPLGARGEGLTRVYVQGLGGIPKEELSSKMQKIFIERFQIPLALGILFLVLEFMLTENASPKKFKLPNLFKKKSALIALFLCLSFSARAADGFKAYEKGDYKKAVFEYETLLKKKENDPLINFNLGAATYKNNEPEKSEKYFQQALTTDNLNLQQKAYYNLGNTQYRVGQKTKKENPQQTIAQWESAVQSYENALKLNPDNKDAKFNLEFVKKKLEELKKQQQQKNQENQNDQQKNNQQNQSQENQNQKDQDQNQNSQNNQPKDQQKQNSEQKKNNQQQEQQNQQEKDSQKNKSGNKEQKKQGEQKQQNSQQQEQKSQQEKQQEQNDKSAREQQKREQEQHLKQIEANRQAGQMTQEEAEALLNQLKNEDAHPLFQAQPSQQENLNDPTRDW